MQDKEIEKILQEKAEKVEMREFSQVWQEIKGEMQEPEKKKTFGFKRWFPIFLASFLAVFCIVFTPILIKHLTPVPPKEELFFSDELTTQGVSETEMFSGLSQAKIFHVDLSQYLIDSCTLYLTDQNKVKGATFNMYSNGVVSCLALIKLYDKSVDLKLNFSYLYDQTYKVNSTDVKYKFVEESGELYRYNFYAKHNSVQYVIEYSGVTDNLIDFLNEFFG